MAAILAGGYGKRLRPLTIETPKPLLEVAGKPILVHTIEWLKYYGINEFVILVGYLKDKIIGYLGSGSKFDVSVVYSVEDEPLGTGGALKNAASILSKNEKFLIVNGDVLTNLDPRPLLDVLDRGFYTSIASVQLRSPYGILQLGENDVVLGFSEKPILKDYWINAGVYGAVPKMLEYLPSRGDIERTTFPALASEGKIVAIKYDITRTYWKSIDSVKDLEEANRDLLEMGGLVPRGSPAS
ncbi:nucleotidyltransferase family protein [Stetteria hydrogenophila]